MIKISASILSANFANLEQEIKKVEQAGADFIHIDVMDGNFVDNITIGAPVITSIRKTTNMIFDVHLMINRPEFFIESFAKAGADIITIHQEATQDLRSLLLEIKKFGIKCGVSLRPKTPIESILPCLDILDLILIMTVEPGFSGQGFMHSQLEKIKQARNLIYKSKREIFLEVDGGINDKTCSLVKDAGANVLVSGSYIFESKDGLEMKDRIDLLKTLTV